MKTLTVDRHIGQYPGKDCLLEKLKMTEISYAQVCITKCLTGTTAKNKTL